MAEKEKRRATTFRTSKGTIVNVAAPTVYVSPAFLSTEDVTNPTELREALREELLLDPYIKSIEDRVIKPFAGNPVFSFSGAGFDAVDVGEPGVIRFQGKYYMVYQAKDVANVYSIGMVESEDGINWTNRTQILTKGVAGDWDDGGVVSPKLYLVGNYFYIFYSGLKVGYGDVNGFGLARANAVGGAYVKLGQIVSRGGAGAWDSSKCDSNALVYFDGEYRVYYEGHSWPVDGSRHKIGYAYSSNVEGPYTKYAGNPVMRPGNPDEWDSSLVKDCDIHVFNDILYMVYWGNSYAPGGAIWQTGGLGLAYSIDGKTWVKSPKNPLIEQTTITGEFSTCTVQSFCLVNMRNGVWAIYWEGNDLTSEIGIAWLIHREQKVKTRQKIVGVTSIGIGATQSVTFNNLGVEDLAVTVKVTYGGAATSGVRAYLLASHDRTNFDSQNTADAYTYFEPSFLAGGTRQRTVPVDPRTAWLRLSIENLDAAIAQGAVEAWLHRVERYEHLMGI